MKWFKCLLALGMAGAIAFSSFATAGALAIPQQNFQNLTVGDDGYVQLHQYITPIAEANSYKDEMTLSVNVLPPTTDIVFVIDGSKHVGNISVASGIKSAWDQILDGVAAASEIFLNPTLNPNGETGALRTRIWVVVYDHDAYILDSSGNLQSYSNTVQKANYFVSNKTKTDNTRLTELKGNAAGSYADLDTLRTALGKLRTSHVPQSDGADQRYIAKGLARAYDIFFDTTPTADPTYVGKYKQQEAARKCVFLLSTGGDYEAEFNSAANQVGEVLNPAGTSYDEPREILVESAMRKEAIFVAKALKASEDKYKWYFDSMDKLPYIDPASIQATASTSKTPIWETFNRSATIDLEKEYGVATTRYAIDSRYVERLTHEVRASSNDIGTGSPSTRNYASTNPFALTASPNLQLGPNPSTPSPADATVPLIDDRIIGVDGYTIKATEQNMSDTYKRIKDHGGLNAEIWTIALDTDDAPATLPQKGSDTEARASKQIDAAISGLTQSTSAFDSSAQVTPVWSSRTRDYGVRTMSGGGTLPGTAFWSTTASHANPFPQWTKPNGADDIWLNSLQSSPENSPATDKYDRAYTQIAYPAVTTAHGNADFPQSIGQTISGASYGNPGGRSGAGLAPNYINYSNGATLPLASVFFDGTPGTAPLTQPFASALNATKTAIADVAIPYPLRAEGVLGNTHDSRVSEYLIALAGTYAPSNQGMVAPWEDSYTSFGGKMISNTPYSYRFNYVGSNPSLYGYVHDTDNDGFYNDETPVTVNHYAMTFEDYYLDYFKFSEQMGMNLKLDGYWKAIQEYRKNNMNDTNPDEYPLHYRWVTANNANRMVRWQFQKYAYEMFCVSPGGNAENEINEHYACNRDAVTSLASVIPEEFLDGAGTAASNSNLVTWKLPKIYLGTTYKLTFTAKFEDASTLPSTMMYPLSSGAYAKLKVITMTPAFNAAKRFVTLDSVCRTFPYAALPAVSGSQTSSAATAPVDHRLDDYVPKGPRASSAVFTIPTSNSPATSSAVSTLPVTPPVVLVEEVRVEEGTLDSPILHP